MHSLPGPSPQARRAGASSLFFIAKRVGRTLLLMLCAAAGTILLVRCAPGFFSDDREMDAKYAMAAQAEISAQSESQGSIVRIAMREVESWAKGDFGESRQYGVPVAGLVGARMSTSATLLMRGILCGWLFAIVAALPISCLRKGGSLLGLPFTILLSVPTAAMATACILADAGGPVLVLSHILPNAAPQLRALATLSIVTALGALVPIEVIFNVPGVGQLAWSAVMNRDLPVLVAVSLLMASVVGLAGMLSSSEFTLEAA